MVAAERVAYVERLRSGRTAFLDALAGLSPSQATFRTAPEAWSILDIAEHIAITEHGMYQFITKYFEPLETPVFGREQEILTHGIPPRPLAAPERAQPKGRYGSIDEAAGQFAANRDRTIRFVEGCEEDLRARAANHPLGRMTCQECLAIMIDHPLRHAEQIRKIRASPGFPAL